jgi:hypothetical protein
MITKKLHIILPIFICAVLFGVYLLNRSLLLNFKLLSTGGSVSEAKPEIPNKVPDSIIFDKIYKNNAWGEGSGPGSYASNTVQYRELLQKIFDDDRYQSFVDIGCGDFQIMKLMKLSAKKSYIGIDVVADVIEKNKKVYGIQNPNYQFHHIQDLRTLKRGHELLKGDMLIVKDILIHFSIANINYFIENVLSNFKYALITNDYSGDGLLNSEIPVGSFRPVDLTQPPFSLKNMELVLQYNNDHKIKRVYLYTNPSV